jgi:hypothetical protein
MFFFYEIGAAFFCKKSQEGMNRKNVFDEIGLK